MEHPDYVVVGWWKLTGVINEIINSNTDHSFSTARKVKIETAVRIVTDKTMLHLLFNIQHFANSINSVRKVYGDNLPEQLCQEKEGEFPCVIDIIFISVFNKDHIFHMHAVECNILLRQVVEGNKLPVKIDKVEITWHSEILRGSHEHIQHLSTQVCSMSVYLFPMTPNT